MNVGKCTAWASVMVWFRSRLNWSRALPPRCLAGAPRYGHIPVPVDRTIARRFVNTSQEPRANSLLGFRAAKRQSTVKQRGCTILALLYRRVGRLAHLDLAARSPETMVRRDGTLTIILSGLREFQQTTPVDVRSCPSCARSSSTSNIGAPMHRATKQLRSPSSKVQKALD